MSLPHSIRITEVGPRDGLQSVAKWIPTDQKVRLVDALAQSGVAAIEATSFVSRKAVPQLADAREVMGRITRKPGVTYRVLVPNLTGTKLAIDSRPDELVFVLSASETHNYQNVRRSVHDSILEFQSVLAHAIQEGVRKVNATIATAFGCPFQGHIPPGRVIEIALRLRDLGASTIILADTTGMANPVSVARLLDALERLVPLRSVAVHFHNTRGTGLANVVSALERGVEALEGSIGGLGGCPFAPGANGNVATEDMAAMLEEMGVLTGVDVPALIACAKLACQVVGQDLPGQVMKAGRISELHSAPLPAGQLVTPTGGIDGKDVEHTGVP